MADWFLFEGRRFGNPHALIRPGESRPIITDTNMRVMLEMTRGLAGPGQMVHRYYSSFDENGLPEYNRTYYYHSRESSLRSTTSDIPGLMTRIGLRFMHPSEDVNFGDLLTFYWVNDIRDFCQYNHPSCPGDVGGLPRLTFQSEQNPIVNARLSRLLRNIGVSEQLIVDALGMAPRTTPSPSVNYRPFGYALEPISSGDVGLVNWDALLRVPPVTLPPKVVPAQPKDTYQDYVYGAGDVFPSIDDMWGPPEDGIDTIIYYGDLYRYVHWDEGDWRLWDEPSEATAGSYWADRQIRHLKPEYRFRFGMENIHFGDFVFWETCDLSRASHCVRCGDIGKVVDGNGVVITRADVDLLHNVRQQVSGWRYLNPGESLISGDICVPFNAMLNDPVHVVTDADQGKYIRPIGYKHGKIYKPEFPVDLPDGFIANQGNPVPEPRDSFVGFWLGRTGGIISYDFDEYGNLPPQMARYIVSKVNLTPLMPVLEPHPGITVRFKKKLDICDYTISTNAVNALILNIHGVMVIRGSLGVNGPGWNFHTRIGQFVPCLFDVNGTERLVFVSHNISSQVDMENRLSCGLGQMVSASSFYTGGTYAIASQHCNLASYTTGRQVEL